MSIRRMTEDEIKQVRMDHPDFLGFDIPDGEEVRMIIKPNRDGLQCYLHPLPRHIEDQMPRPPSDQFPPIPAAIEEAPTQEESIVEDEDEDADSVVDIDELGLDAESEDDTEEEDLDTYTPRRGLKRSAAGSSAPSALKKVRPNAISDEGEGEEQEMENNNTTGVPPYFPDVPRPCRLLKQFRHTLSIASEGSRSPAATSLLEEGWSVVDWVGSVRWNPANSAGSKLEYHVKWQNDDRMTWEPRRNIPAGLLRLLEEEHGQVEQRYREYQNVPMMYRRSD